MSRLDWLVLLSWAARVFILPTTTNQQKPGANKCSSARQGRIPHVSSYTTAQGCLTCQQTLDKLVVHTLAELWWTIYLRLTMSCLRGCSMAMSIVFARTRVHLGLVDCMSSVGNDIKQYLVWYRLPPANICSDLHSWMLRSVYFLRIQLSPLTVRFLN